MNQKNETLQKIKAVLANESQAIRLIEQYGEWVREVAQKESETVKYLLIEENND